MNIQFLKDILMENSLYIEEILIDCMCNHVSDYGTYIGFAFPSGDNKKGGIVYKDSLIVNSHTRDIGGSDFIDLIKFLRQESFYKTLQYLSNYIGIGNYKDNSSEFFSLLNKLSKIKDETEEDVSIKTYDENILNYYHKFSNIDFEKDGISVKTQHEFEVMYCQDEHLAIIPIRDMFGGLVGVKARKMSWIKDYAFDGKYIYLHSCPKSKLLYGLHKTYEHIKDKNEIIIVESEKSVMKLWEYGYKNAVAIGGHSLSKHQIKAIKMMNVEIVIAFDQDIELKEVESEIKKIDNIKNVWYIIDNSLKEKESPADVGLEKWNELYKNRRLNNGI